MYISIIYIIVSKYIYYVYEYLNLYKHSFAYTCLLILYCNSVFYVNALMYIFYTLSYIKHNLIDSTIFMNASNLN